MTLIILLFAIAMVMCAVEVIIPGGVLGTLGGLMMFGACALSFQRFGAIGGSIAVAVALILATLTLYIEFRWLPRTAIGKRAFLHSQITGVSSTFGKNAQPLIGKPAVALTMLSPSGYVSVDGKRHEAFCPNGQIPAGSSLTVTGADNFRLIVSPSNT